MRRTSWLFASAMFVAMFALAAAAVAQDPTGLPVETPPPALVLPEPVPPAAPAPPPAPACTPSCRVGFTCMSSGQCVSSCNPPCVLGDECSAAGQCVRRPVEPLPGSEYSAAQDSGFERHDGFFMRLTTGFGGGALVLDGPDRLEEAYSGAGWSSTLDIGGSPIDNLVIHGRLRDASILGPKVEVDGEELGDRDGVVVSQAMIGAGLQYYFMPINLYIGGAIGLAGVEAVRERRGRADIHRHGKVGLGVDLDVGKEWWISENWGIGVAGQLSVAVVPASDSLGEDAAFGGAFFSLLFSATYQ